MKHKVVKFLVLLCLAGAAAFAVSGIDRAVESPVVAIVSALVLVVAVTTGVCICVATVADLTSRKGKGVI